MLQPCVNDTNEIGLFDRLDGLFNNQSPQNNGLYFCSLARLGRHFRAINRNNRMTTKIKWLYAFLLALLFAAGAWFGSSQIPDHGNKALQHLGGEFTFNSANGPVSLSDYKGKVVALYFGFLSCPDVCPTSLASLSAAIRTLSPQQQAGIQPLFITVDPERDGLDRLDEFTAFFYPSMQGLSGDLAYTDKVVRQYGGYFRHIQLENSYMEYTVDHTSRIYLIDQQGQLVETLPHGSKTETIAATLASYL